MAENPIADRVANDADGVREIGFAVPKRYNASAILTDANLDGASLDPAADCGAAARG